MADRAGWWWSCICRCCGTTAEAEIAGDSGCLCPCAPSIADASLPSPASGVVRLPGSDRETTEGLGVDLMADEPLQFGGK
ncbi:hypothetical protein E2562_010419 [Oryza meyeriana var. granulata]|uniref:Uncharacterized protein n=1 Tax=Oryza meyeriana var. granulata TaxID=110450 RepID=A0A6G1F6P2_9ORYZ|nr:hypothetical protein E2562_010419 [Oryza meyeriana var. granulata]